MMTTHDNTAARGFTLIELLVAMAISLIVGYLAYGFFSSASTAAESTDDVLQNINELESVWQTLVTDLDHVVDRQLPAAAAGIGSGGLMPAFVGGDDAPGNAGFLQGAYVLRLARDGWSNPLHQQRSDLQRIGYRWIDGELWRDYWAEKNQPLDTEPQGTRLLIDDLEAIRVRFLPAGAPQVSPNAWQDSWPPRGTAQREEDAAALPMAVEVTLSLENVGDVRRVFSLPGF